MDDVVRFNCVFIPFQHRLYRRETREREVREVKWKEESKKSRINKPTMDRFPFDLLRTLYYFYYFYLYPTTLYFSPLTTHCFTPLLLFVHSDCILSTF